MAEKNNATCSICGKAYHVCLSCKDSMANHPWRVHTDTSEHYKVYQVLRGLSTGVYTKEETKEKLKNIDLHDLCDFRPHIKSLIEEILKEDEDANYMVINEESQSIKKVSNYKKKNYKTKDKILETE